MGRAWGPGGAGQHERGGTWSAVAAAKGASSGGGGEAASRRALQAANAATEPTPQPPLSPRLLPPALTSSSHPSPPTLSPAPPSPPVADALAHNLSRVDEVIQVGLVHLRYRRYMRGAVHEGPGMLACRLRPWLALHCRGNGQRAPCPRRQRAPHTGTLAPARSRRAPLTEVRVRVRGRCVRRLCLAGGMMRRTPTITTSLPARRGAAQAG